MTCFTPKQIQSIETVETDIEDYSGPLADNRYGTAIPRFNFVVNFIIQLLNREDWIHTIGIDRTLLNKHDFVPKLLRQFIKLDALGIHDFSCSETKTVLRA
jgi:hypothetical protein